jgi:hypothetical protein
MAREEASIFMSKASGIGRTSPNLGLAHTGLIQAQTKQTPESEKEETVTSNGSDSGCARIPSPQKRHFQAVRVVFSYPSIISQSKIHIQHNF